jgi:hypothetical protein
MDNHNSKEDYSSITSGQAYELVKNGVWSLEKFQIWLDHVIVTYSAAL